MKTVDQREYMKHIKRKTNAQENKEADKVKAKCDPSVKVLTMILQSLLLCPKLEASCMYYRTKLCCHNFTMFNLATGAINVTFGMKCRPI